MVNSPGASPAILIANRTGDHVHPFRIIFTVIAAHYEARARPR